MSDDVTQEFRKITDELDHTPSFDRLQLLADALGLVAELWPSPAHASVTLETHQWVKLRQVLLSVPDLLALAER